MPNSTQSPPAVAVLMQTQLGLIDAYRQHLDQIKAAVSGNDNDRLNHLVDNNAALFEPMERGLQHLLNALPALGYPASSEGFDRFIATSADARLTGLKAELDERLQQLQQSLLVNDRLIRQSRHRVRQCIRILSGHGGSQADATYDRQGDRHDGSGDRRVLARA